MLRAVSKSTLLPRTQSRCESTTRRHRKLLRVNQAPSYTPSTTEPTIIYNPPSAAPSVYHTPLKFLPASDARRQMYSSALVKSTLSAYRTHTAPTASAGTPLSTQSLMPPKPSANLPPPVRAPYEKKYHLSEKEIEEIRQLRREDPDTWTRVKLAERYGCSQFFVGMVAKNGEKAERVARGHEESRGKWGKVRREAREMRGRRREMWGRDE